MQLSNVLAADIALETPHYEDFEKAQIIYLSVPNHTVIAVSNTRSDERPAPTLEIAVYSSLRSQAEQFPGTVFEEDTYTCLYRENRFIEKFLINSQTTYVVQVTTCSTGHTRRSRFTGMNKERHAKEAFEAHTST